MDGRIFHIREKLSENPGFPWTIGELADLVGLSIPHFQGCVYVFGYSNRTENVLAAPCIQECQSNQNECNDNCDYECSEYSTQEDCDSCLSACSHTYFQCLSYAVSCDDMDVQPGRCEVEYAQHCPIISGQANCSDPSAYNDYFLICDLPFGMGQCVSCPWANYYCVGQGNLGHCPF